MISIRNLSFSYGKKNVFSNLSLTIKKGESVALMGASGCGKSTLLQLIAGLRKPLTSTEKLTVNAKKTAYAFQEPRLFPWLTVEQNLSLVLPREAEGSAISNMLDALKLADAAPLYPHQLSGGMACRVSLARALLYDADLLLLDEPLSALDQETKQTVLSVLKDYLSGRNKTLVLVTHQKDEADALCDRTLQFEELENKTE